MAFPYTVIGPGGQPYIVGQIPMMQQAMAPQLIQQVPMQVAPQPMPQQVQVPQPQVPKQPDYMSEDKLQEKGEVFMFCGLWLLGLIQVIGPLS